MTKHRLILVGMLSRVSDYFRLSRHASSLVYDKAAAFGYDVHLTNKGNLPNNSLLRLFPKHHGHGGSADSSVRVTDAVYQWLNDKPLAPGQN
jgi:hypothetical protein